MPGFSSRRGRPRIPRAGADSGTPELVLKRALGETAEVLDLCLERGLITAEQHWCGIHLRWLHTLRYGAPGARALDTTHPGGSELKADDPKWRAARELEYQEAMARLRMAGYDAIALRCCVYNERPPFLRRPARLAAGSGQQRHTQMQRFQYALDLLTALWCRQSSINTNLNVE